ncbi:MAG TPA: alanyl-tRNA editing protein AlaXM [Methanotrichaceae archaeon]|nr:alanyl-tRNA editing protein AlaXM [Methanotrichaceae archaeon]
MKAIYLEDSYLRAFDAVVLSASGDRVILDKTAFYPASGGQPSDQGSLCKADEEFKVLSATILDGQIAHIVDRDGLKSGDRVHAVLDWERRYRFMRSHTACHILSAVIFRETGAKITGNQIDLSRSRVDFSLESFDKAKMSEYVEEANRLIGENRSVKINVLPRDEALAIPDLVRLAMEVPDRDEIRVVEIEGIDAQACGGTHVKSTGEIGRIKMIKAENKGKSNRRVYFALEE